MARFGQGINPQLSAVDYSPIMQGTQIAAQGIQQGGQNIGNALAGLGQQIGSGLQQRAEYKAQIKAGNDAIKAISGLKNIPPEIQAMAQQAQQRLQDPNLSLVEQAKIGAQVNQLFSGVMQSGIQSMMQQQAQAADKQAMNVAIAAMKSGNMDPLSAVQSMGMQVSPAVANFVADYQQSQAQTGKLRAETAALGRPKPQDLSFQEQAVQAAIADFTAQSGRSPSQGELFGIYQTVAQMSKPQTSISVGAGPTEYEKTVGKVLGERDVAMFESAQKFPADTNKLLELSQNLSTGDINTGIFAEVQTNFDRVRSQLLNDEKAGKRVTRDQIVDSLLGSDVFPMIGALGIGARGLDTPAEREFLMNVYTGSRKLDPAALEELARIRYNVNLRATNKYNSEVASGRMKKFSELYGAEVKPVQQEFGDLEVPSGVTLSEWAYMTPEERKVMATAGAKKGRK